MQKSRVQFFAAKLSKRLLKQEIVNFLFFSLVEYVTYLLWLATKKENLNNYARKSHFVLRQN